MSEVKPEAADDNVVPLEVPQTQSAAKGLFPRSAIYWGGGILIFVLVVLAIRDVSKGSPGGSQAAKPAGAAASVAANTLGPKPSGDDIAQIARRQIDVGQKQEAASAAAVARRGAADDNESSQIAGAGGVKAQNGSGYVPQPTVQGSGRPAPMGDVQPNVPYPSHPSPMGDVRGQTTRANHQGGSSDSPEIDAAATQVEMAKHMGAIVSLQGDDDGGVAGAVKGAVDAVQQATGGGGGSTASDAVQKATDAALRQVQGLMKTANNDQPGQVLNAAAAVAHPTNRDVNWLKDYASEGARAASEPQLTLMRAKKLPTRNVVLQGTRVPIVTREAVNSDQPGDIEATSRADVYDSLTQTRVLIPRGTRFLGRYSSEIRPGQSRLLFAFNRMILPDGSSVDLMGAQGSDNLGRAGVEGNVDNHFLQMFGYSMAIAWLGNKIGNSGTSTATVGANGQVATSSLAGQVVGQVAQQILQRNASIPPTLTKEAAAPLFITITSDIALDPWQKAK